MRVVLAVGQDAGRASRLRVLAHCLVRWTKPGRWEEVSGPKPLTGLYCPTCGLGLPHRAGLQGSHA